MKKLHSAILFTSLIFFSASALASGLSKPVLVGPRAIGMGGAFVGVADDPTAIFHNPAGITQLEGHQIQAGIDGLITDLTHTPDAAFNPTGIEEKAKTEFLPVPQFGYTTNFYEPISLGLGFFFPHGNGGKFSTDSINPFNPNEGRIYSMEISPTIAWQIIPELSLGASLRIVRVSSDLKGGLFPLPPAIATAIGQPTDTLVDSSFSGWGVGGAIGLLYRPMKYFSFGFNYRTQVKAGLDGSVELAALGAQNGSYDQKLPTLINTGFGIFPMEKLTLGIQYGFENNSELNQLDITLDSGQGLTLPQQYTDSHTIHVGGDYKIIPSLSLLAGYAKDLYHSIPDTYMDRVVGDIAAHEASLGLAWYWKNWTFAGTWNGRFGSRDIPVTNVDTGNANKAPGNYEAFVNSVSMSVGVAL